MIFVIGQISSTKWTILCAIKAESDKKNIYNNLIEERPLYSHSIHFVHTHFLYTRPNRSLAFVRCFFLFLFFHTVEHNFSLKGTKQE